MQRRRFIAATATTTAVATAGCFGIFEDDTDSPDGAAETMIEASLEGDADEVDDLLHPESPLDANQVALDNGETVSSSTIDGEVQIEDFTSENVEEATEVGILVDRGRVESLQEDEDLALVRVSVEVESGGEVDIHVLTATDGDEWLVLNFGTQFDF